MGVNPSAMMAISIACSWKSGTPSVFSAGRFAFSERGGACPIWNIHETFTDPRRLHTQMVELPGGST